MRIVQNHAVTATIRTGTYRLQTIPKIREQTGNMKTFGSFTLFLYRFVSEQICNLYVVSNTVFLMAVLLFVNPS